MASRLNFFPFYTLSQKWPDLKRLHRHSVLQRLTRCTSLRLNFCQLIPSCDRIYSQKEITKQCININVTLCLVHSNYILNKELEYIYIYIEFFFLAVCVEYIQQRE